MVPIAPFGIFGSVFQGSGGMVALAYAIGMVAMMFTALSYAQMSQAFPMAGSVYTYAGRGIAAPVGFLSGWMILLDYVLVPGLLYLIAGIAMNSLVPSIPVWIWLIGFVVLNTVVNYMGIEMTAKVNKIMLVGELVVLAIFIVIGIVALAQGKGRGFDFTPIYNADTFSLAAGASGRCRSRCCPSSASTASRCWPRRTRSPRGRSAARWWPRCCWPATLFIVQTWVASLLVPDPDAADQQGRPRRYGVLRRCRGRRRRLAGEAHRARDRHRLGLRELARGAGRHVAAAVRDGPRPAAAVLPGQGAPEEGRARSTRRC